MCSKSWLISAEALLNCYALLGERRSLIITGIDEAVPPISLISGECTRHTHISAGRRERWRDRDWPRVGTERFFISIHAAGNADRKREEDEENPTEELNKDESGHEERGGGNTTSGGPRKAIATYWGRSEKGFRNESRPCAVVKITSQTGGNDNIVDAAAVYWVRQQTRKSDRNEEEILFFSRPQENNNTMREGDDDDVGLPC